MRQFQPKSFGIKRDFFAKTIEKRLQHAGEYVYHLPANGKRQAVVMNYQYLPTDTGDDYLIPNTNPTLYGYVEHFIEIPLVYREGNSVRQASGSQFEVRGLTYNVKKVDVNHRGYITVELVRADNCETPRAEFNEEISELLPCSNECD